MSKTSSSTSGGTNKAGRNVHFQEIPTEKRSRDGILRYQAVYGDYEPSSVSSDLSPLSFSDWIQLMKSNKGGIADQLTELLQRVPFLAFRLETPGVSAETMDQQAFEFVLIQDTYLETFASNEDPNTFAEHLQCNAADSNNNHHNQDHNIRHGPAACAFMNLSGDAMLIAPRKWDGSKNSNYHGHLANFMRGASREQIVGVWAKVATTLEEALLQRRLQQNKRPLWFSTAGDGVAWLHFRIDSRPKYYHYAPFREFSK